MKEQEPLIFKKLKRKFIGSTIVASTVILLIAFTTVYAVAYNATVGRGRPKEQFRVNVSDDVSLMFEERLETERENHLKTLLVSLIVTGISLEIIVAIFAVLHAEASIRPVRDAYNAQKNFIANASHEIKTPLAIIQANLEAADIHGDPWLDNVAKKAEDLAALNNQLLSLARMESGTDEIKLEKINLKDEVQEIADCYLPKLNKKSAKLKITATKDAKLEKTINRAEFNQLMNILIDNAVKYCDKKITVTISDREISVKNDGATIPPENLPHIFDRFYQTDKTKSGVGLGLAIGHSIANHNKWTLKAMSDKHSTTFLLQF